ncbi:MAG: putative ABC transporter ATP-binding protein [Gammaproteobacteria bacterium]|nr:putative ABC transporter ATP-binding protein [Gammaproteobacteria bacterium]
MIMLTVEGLAFGYRNHTVGTDVNLSVRPSDVVCLLGPNGSGKTTLFKSLLGLLPCHAGAIRLNGTGIHSMSRADIARLVAYVPQAHHDAFPYTVHEIVLMGRTIHRGIFSAPSSTDHEFVEQTLNDLGLAGLSDRDCTKISGGQRQMVMIARALVQDASLIIMDEPTAGLDFGNQLLILQQVKRMASKGMGIVLSTHNPDHAFDCATRVLVLHRGSIRAAGAPVEVLNPDVLGELYGVAIDVEKVNNGYVVRARCNPFDENGAADTVL